MVLSGWGHSPDDLGTNRFLPPDITSTAPDTDHRSPFPLCPEWGKMMALPDVAGPFIGLTPILFPVVKNH